MLLLTIMRIAFRSIVANKLRSFLAILGIIIGVASVIAMLALGEGTRKKVTAQMRNFGANLLSVRPDYRSNAGGIRTGAYESLKLADAEAILAQVPEVEMVTPDLDADFTAKYQNKNKRVQVNGEAVTYFTIRSFPIEKGRAFTEDEVNRSAHVVVMGPKTAEALFEDKDPIGELVKIKGCNFRVVGVTKSKDDHSDDNVWAPYTTVMSQLMGRTSINQIYCRVRDHEDMTAVMEKIKAVMRKQHRIQSGMPEDVSVRNNQEAADSVAQVAGTFTMLLAGVAAISLLVGGVNIMNIMLVTVTERTREIGVRKALGARNIDVLTQFVIEATTISMTGGILGVAIGIGIVVGFNSMTERLMGEAYGAVVQMLPVVVSFGFSCMIGVFFGWYPAQKAARLDPIEALHYE